MQGQVYHANWSFILINCGRYLHAYLCTHKALMKTHFLDTLENLGNLIARKLDKSIFSMSTANCLLLHQTICTMFSAHSMVSESLSMKMLSTIYISMTLL